MSLLALESAIYAYPGAPPVLNGVSAAAGAGELIAIIGPNGAGKSTLLDLVAGLKTPASGRCLVDGRDSAATPRGAWCRLVAHVPQQAPANVPFTVEEVVLTGRIPYGRGLYENDDDYRAMEEAMERMRLAPFRDRSFQTLSGGEQQRVLLAAALAQQSPVLLLDEPSAHLDPQNEARLWALLHDLRALGRLILVVTHHLLLAAHHSDRIWLLHHGTLAADGTPGEALQPERLQAVFGVPFHRHTDEHGRLFLSYGN